MRALVRLVAVVVGLLLAGAGGGVGAETRVALVVGISAYQHTTPLTNPLNDARDMAAALTATGFDVTEALDADKRSLERALRTFTDKLARADVALLFYAGHGLQVGQENWLVPADARLERERDLAFEAVKLEFVLSQLEIDRAGKTTIVLLDACRDNPLGKNLARSMGTRSAAIGKGLAAASTGLGTFIAYATQPGNVALDGEASRNSPFTAALLKQMRIAGRNLPATMIEVRKEVVAATAGRQVPWDHSALTGDFYFVPAAAGAAGGAPAAGGGGAAGADVAALEARLKQLEADAKRRDDEARKAGAGPGTGAKAGEDFLVRPDNWLVGRRILEHDATAYEPCRSQCRSDERCIGFDWFASEKGGICRHFGEVERRDGRPGWRSGVKPGWVQQAASAPTAPPPGAAAMEVRDGMRPVGDVLASQRQSTVSGCAAGCRSTGGCVGYSWARDGTCELFSRVTGWSEEGGRRSGVRADLWAQLVAASPVAPLPKAETMPPVATIPPVEPKAARPGGAATGLTLDEGVRIDGNAIESPARATSPDICRQRCADTPGCIGFMHGKRIPQMGQCHLFDRIDRRQEDPGWRSGVRAGGAAPAATAGGATGGGPTTLSLDTLLVSDSHSRIERGFLVYETTNLLGPTIKASPADSSAACATVCQHTPGCVAAVFMAEQRGTVAACVTRSAVTDVVGGDEKATAIVRPKR